jgi:hypothetical protein
VFGLDQTAIYTLAIFECLEKGGFACTRRHFPKRVRFVTAVVFLNWKHHPGIAPKKRIWLQRGAYFFLNPKWIWPGTAFAVDGASEAARVFFRFFKSGCFACTRRAFSRARNHWKYKASESDCFASTKHLFLGSYNYKFAKFHTTGNRDCKDSGNGLMDIRQNAFFNLQSARPKAPGGARRRQEEPESTRRHQEATGGARRRQEARGGARKHQEAPGGARRRQEAPGGTQQSPSRCQEAPSRRQQTPGGTRKHQ